MDSIKRLITITIPNNKCNLKCEYCYISQLEAWEEPVPSAYGPAHIAKCLSRERLGGPCMINFTANGETLLQPDLPEIVELLLKEGHYIEIVTNCIPTKPLEKLLSIDSSLLPRLEFKVSFHYKELKRLGLFDRFFDNISCIHDAGAAFTLELMAYDGIENEIDDIVQICTERVGAVCHATIGRDESTKKRTLLTRHSKEEFQRVWRPLDSDMMDLKFKLLDVKRREFCYAGCWSLHVDLNTGEASQCYWMPHNQNIFKNPDEPIKFLPVGHFCPQPFCLNGHAHLALGLIPELDVPTYTQIRDRECGDGTHWLTDECRSFFSTKMKVSNRQYSKGKKIAYSIAEPFILLLWFVTDKDTKVRVKKYLRRYVLKKGR